jgi:hypothetical protein
MKRLQWLLGMWMWMLLVLASAWPAAAQADGAKVNDIDRTAIRAVIQRQIDAFRRDDGPAAFALASPSIQAIFHSPEQFMAMVKASYLPVYRPKHVAFLEVEADSAQVVQKVLLVGPDGVQVMALYPMVKLPDGSWVTDGCTLVNLPSKSA